jgi:hypothetical protein
MDCVFIQRIGFLVAQLKKDISSNFIGCPIRVCGGIGFKCIYITTTGLCEGTEE